MRTVNTDTLCECRWSHVSHVSCFNRPYCSDVTLKSEDDQEFPCHKSILCARLGTWIRTDAQMFLFIRF